MKSNINFANPFNGKKWLSLLENHDRYGVLFKKNLNIGCNYMGFSFNSNKLGLRGKENISSEIVICGTSYAMGLSVNNGENWYELNSITNYAFNIGMPIGPYNHLALLEDYYNGEYKELIYVYHPNIWAIAQKYEEIRQSSKSTFEEFNWKTNNNDIIKLYIKWKKRTFEEYLLKQNIICEYKNITYSFTKNYAYFDFVQNKTFIDNQIKILEKLFDKFEKVTIIRVPIKEELGLNYIYSSELRRLNQNYDELWNYFVQSISDDYKKLRITNKFELDDYLPNDTHWSRKGNKTFIGILEELEILPKNSI